MDKLTRKIELQHPTLGDRNLRISQLRQRIRDEEREQLILTLKLETIKKNIASLGEKLESLTKASL